MLCPCPVRKSGEALKSQCIIMKSMHATAMICMYVSAIFGKAPAYRTSKYALHVLSEYGLSNAPAYKINAPGILPWMPRTPRILWQWGCQACPRTCFHTRRAAGARVTPDGSSKQSPSNQRIIHECIMTDMIHDAKNNMIDSHIPNGRQSHTTSG